MNARTDAWRDHCRDMQDSAPDIRILWQKTPTARRPHLCDCCGDPINVGEKYDAVGLIEDGRFRYEKTHRWAHEYPSGCPKLGPKDAAELAAANPPEFGFPMERNMGPKPA